MSMGQDQQLGNDSNNADHKITSAKPEQFGGDAESTLRELDPISANAPIELIECPRCGKLVEATGQRCPLCDARLPRTLTTAPSAFHDVTFSRGSHALEYDRDASNGFTRLFAFYGILLATSLVLGWIGKNAITARMPEEEANRVALTLTCVFEAIDTLIVVIALAVLPRPPKCSRLPRQRLLGWLSGPPVLALVLGLNLGYHSLVQSYVQTPDWALEHWEFSPLVILVLCIQPGIVEELFFRYLAQGTLSRTMNVHLAVWITAIMFGMCHVFVPLSIPILTVVGAGLGYVRYWSGSMVLPMILHAAHNAVVIWLEQVL